MEVTPLQLPRPTPHEVLAVAAGYYRLGVEDIIGPSRARHLWEPRQVVVLACRLVTDWSFPALGRLMGRHHATLVRMRQLAARSPHLHAEALLLADGAVAMATRIAAAALVLGVPRDTLVVEAPAPVVPIEYGRAHRRQRTTRACRA